MVWYHPGSTNIKASIFKFALGRRKEEIPEHSPETVEYPSLIEENHESKEELVTALNDSNRRMSVVIPKQRQKRERKDKVPPQTKFSHLLCLLCCSLMTKDRRPKLLSCGHSACEDCVKQFPVFGIAHDSKLHHDSIETATASDCKQDAHKPHGFSFLDLLFTRKEDNECDAPVDEEPELTIEEKEAKYGHILCLVCREKTVLNSLGLNGLLNNMPLQEEAESVVLKMSVCAECDHNTTAKYCQDCAIYLCDGCSGRLHSGKSTSKHVIFSLDEISPIQASAMSSRCEEHYSEESVLFCIKCDSLACVLCGYGKHKGHSIMLLSNALDDLKVDLQDRQDMIIKERNKIVKASEDLDLEVKLVKERSVSACAFVSSSINEVVESLKKLEITMLEKIEEEAKDKMLKLNGQAENFRYIVKDLNLRERVSSNILCNENAGEAVMQILQQLEVIQTTNSVLPDLKQCVPSVINVALEPVSVELLKWATKLKKQGFPRDANNPIVVQNYDNTTISSQSNGEKKLSLKKMLKEKDVVNSQDDEPSDVDVRHVNKKKDVKKRRKEPKVYKEPSGIEVVDMIDLSDTTDNNTRDAVKDYLDNPGTESMPNMFKKPAVVTKSKVERKHEEEKATVQARQISSMDSKRNEPETKENRFPRILKRADSGVRETEVGTGSNVDEKPQAVHRKNQRRQPYPLDYSDEESENDDELPDLKDKTRSLSQPTRFMNFDGLNATNK